MMSSLGPEAGNGLRTGTAALGALGAPAALGASATQADGRLWLWTGSSLGTKTDSRR
jgi:hypothetical protein